MDRQLLDTVIELRQLAESARAHRDTADTLPEARFHAGRVEAFAASIEVAERALALSGGV